MRKFLFLIILPCLAVSAAQAQPYTTAVGRILFTGEVTNEAGEPLADVHIVNQFNRQVTITDASGFFTTYISKHHVLHFTSVGFETYVFRVDREFDGDMLYRAIVLKPKTYSLREVTVEEEEERVETIARKPERVPMGDFGTLQGREPVPVAPTLMSPVSYLYEMFGSEPKQRRKVAALLRQQRVDSIAYGRLSSEKIWEITGLYGDRLVEFKEFCNLPADFYLYASEYEFLITIRRMYTKFQLQTQE